MVALTAAAAVVGVLLITKSRRVRSAIETGGSAAGRAGGVPRPSGRHCRRGHAAVHRSHEHVLGGGGGSAE